ncbi:hypothetical protein LB505_014303 [Fusarium chuoi]|nr:hypothetical protein LB505_014303 [Fusarium chuoi]
MQFAVQAQHRHWNGKLKPGDVLLTNHPSWGGTHLPDLTVITPVFVGDRIAFYVASRGHHTDIGGMGITSMMPESRSLWEEAAASSSKARSGPLLRKLVLILAAAQHAVYKTKSQTSKHKPQQTNVV